MKAYTQYRKAGGLKGLGTGARSYQRGQQQAKRVIPITRPIIYPKYRSYTNKKEIKTVDHTFEAAYANPYVPDILAKTALNASTTGVLQALMIQQGVGTNQRVGNSCSLKSLRLRFRLVNIDDILVNTMVRMLVVYDRQPNGAYPNLSNILANINEAGTVSAFDPDGDLNVNNMERFTVLMDEWHIVPAVDNNLHVVNTALVGPTNVECFQVDRYIKLRGLEQKYSANSSPMVIANQTTGALYILSCGSIAAGSEPYCWYGKARLRFYDN